MRDHVDKVHSVSIERENMISALFLALRYPLYREETRAEKRPLGQYF